MTYATKDTRNGILRYKVIKTDNGYKGQISHDLHKRARFNGKVLIRYSKPYKTERGVKNWLGRQLAMQQ